MNLKTGAILFAAAGISTAGLAASAEYDVLIYGGSSSGVAAAVQCARMGASVVLVEPSRHIGGLSASGLGLTDIGVESVVGGVAREFYARIRRHYRKENDDVRSPSARMMLAFEPSAAEKVFGEMLHEAGVEPILGERLDLKKGVEKENGRIRRIVMESGRSFTAKMFIDATYEGDLMKLAGVSSTVGREANSQYGERANGIRNGAICPHDFTEKIDPYIRPGDPASGLLPGIEPKAPAPLGAADKRIQAYCFRLCLTDNPANRTPFRRPEAFDEREYELLFRCFEAGNRKIPLTFERVPNCKTDTNNNQSVSINFVGRNYDYPEGDYAVRERIVAAHRTYQEGLLWVLQNHPRVPVEIRTKFAPWGLAADEFCDNGNWPYLLYLREARRMVSDYVLTEHDLRGDRVAEDSVGMGSYAMDAHPSGRFVGGDGFVHNEGTIETLSFGPYPISYRSIVPRRSECENLSVPVCFAATHTAYGSARMEPVFMILGQSAATAAVLAAREGKSLQSVEYAELRRKLLADGQVLATPEGFGVTRDTVEERRKIRLRPGAQKIGTWTPEQLKSGSVEFAVPDKMAPADTAEVIFLYTSGPHATFIRGCLLTDDTGASVAEDRHKGFTGLVSRNHVYRLKATRAVEKGNLKVRFSVTNDNGAPCVSNGEIWLVKE